MILFLIDKRAYTESQKRVCYRKDVKLKRWELSLENDNSEILDINEYRVQVENHLNGVGEYVDRIEYRGHIHKKHCKYAPKILYISEEYEQCRENKTDTDIKNDKTDYRNNK